MSEQDFTSPIVLAENTESAPVATVNETPAENTESAPVAEPVEQNTEAEGAEPSKAVKELIAQRKKRQEAEKEAAYWRGQAEARTSQEPKPPVTQPTISKAPILDDFDTYEEYEVAKELHVIQKAKQEVMREFQQIQHQTHQQKVTQTFWEKVEAAEESDPTIRDTIKEVAQSVSPVVAELVVQSDIGIDLVKWLDSHPKDTARISALPPLLAARELGRIEAQIGNAPKPAPPKKVSQAPEPIKTVSPVGNAITDEDNMSMEQWVARRNKEAKRR